MSNTANIVLASESDAIEFATRALQAVEADLDEGLDLVRQAAGPAYRAGLTCSDLDVLVPGLVASNLWGTLVDAWYATRDAAVARHGARRIGSGRRAC